MKKTRLVLAGVLVAAVASFVGYRHFGAVSTAGAAPEASASQPGQGQPGQGGHTGTHSFGAGSSTHGGGGGTAVITAVAKTQDLPITSDAVGWVEAIQSVSIRPRIDGVIQKIGVTEGQNVQQGDLLFQLDDLALQAVVAKDQATIAKDQATLDQLNSDLKRFQDLLKHADSTPQQVEQQQALIAEGEATIASDKATLQADQVQLGYTKIVSPITGRIGAIAVSNGALVKASDSTPLLTVTEMAPVRVSFPVPERDLQSYRDALAAKTPAQVKAIDPASGKELATGALDFVDSAVDTASGTVTIKARFQNDGLVLWPGQYVRLLTQLGTVPNATVVPLVAVQQNAQGPFVFVVKPDQSVALTQVKAGEVHGDQQGIASGVNPGDHVVVDGQLRLINGSHVTETAQGAAPPQPEAAAAPKPAGGGAS